MLPNTTVLYYGRSLATGVSPIESSYVDYVENDVIAGFVSSNNADSYARIPILNEMIVFNVYDDPFRGSHVRIPGLFTMLGGPAFGPDALVSIIKFYGWTKVVLYFQNAPEESSISETFVSAALSEGIEFDLQKRESAGTGAAEADLSDLQAAKSNIFVFFGGQLLRSREAALRGAAPSAPNGDHDRVTSMFKAHSAGHGCFNDRSTRLVRSRPEIAIICCCALPHSGPLWLHYLYTILAPATCIQLPWHMVVMRGGMQVGR